VETATNAVQEILLEFRYEVPLQALKAQTGCKTGQNLCIIFQIHSPFTTLSLKKLPDILDLWIRSPIQSISMIDVISLMESNFSKVESLP
jgi:hypothetical protein